MLITAVTVTHQGCQAGSICDSLFSHGLELLCGIDEDHETRSKIYFVYDSMEV